LKSGPYYFITPTDIMSVGGEEGMLKLMDKHAIIKLKQSGASNRNVAKLLCGIFSKFQRR